VENCRDRRCVNVEIEDKGRCSSDWVLDSEE
jgi:hypothetical protein